MFAFQFANKILSAVSVNRYNYSIVCLQVDAFTNTDPLSEHDVSTYGNNLSTVDSGIDSLPISRVNTHETLLEGAEESEMIHTSLEERVRKWCDRNDRGQALKFLNR